MIFGYHPLEGGYRIPMRIVGANIPYEWVIYILMLIPLGIFCYGFYQRVQIWKSAEGELHRNDYTTARIASLLWNTLGQKQLIRKPLVGWMHFFLFWGFVLLFIATASFAMWDKTGFPPLTGNLYIGFSAIVDLLGFLAIVGLIVLAINRYIVRPDRLNDTKALDGWILLLTFIVLVTGYILEGARIAAQVKLSTSMAQIAYERVASPVGWIFASVFGKAALVPVLLWHRFLWWFHMALAFLFIAIVPFTKLWHIFTGMIAYYSRDLGPSACRMVENIEEAEHFGVENLEEFGWKDLLDLDACIRCGRCQEACPAYNTGKLLNPKITVIQAMKEHLDQKAPFLLKKNGTEESIAMTAEGAAVVRPDADASLIYEVVTPEVLWACTNCRGCSFHCPMFIEHLHKITEMRRNLVMWQGDMPSEAQMAFTNMERNYNPWGVGFVSRADWLKERNIRDLVNLIPLDDKPFEYLLYAGCAAAFDDRYKKVGEAFIRLLHHAGVDFAYLGTHEHCCGDSARRLGNEYLYQTLAAHNIERFEHYGVKKIICLCPHGYNAIKNEYPQMGGHYEVYHYTEFLQKLVQEGRLIFKDEEALRVSYHDSCFLGRHNGIYDAPRSLIAKAGGKITELDKSRQFGFCCGAGGGRMWLEEESVEGFHRINETRALQLLKSDPERIITNCPFCLTMIQDGVKEAGRGEELSVSDLAELMWSRINV